MNIINTKNAGDIKIFTDDYEPEVADMAKKIGD